MWNFSLPTFTNYRPICSQPSWGLLGQRVTLSGTKVTVYSIKDYQGQTHYEEDKIEQVFIDHFQHLFSHQDTKDIQEAVKVVEGKITQDMHQLLNESYTKEKVYLAMKDLKPLAALGPDGLPAQFYHNYWDIIGIDILHIGLNILNNQGDPSCKTRNFTVYFV
ncbi:uncharacterized protein LOC123883738 [Trifolium pratense]|uniref:Uncharacterized protein n=2 Tax=Trifolium pratense TaxID=57577 RepID=A0ACB0L2B1_TRIPR|nr:uncharacterized protein LOC123883738 [Trifolium pratense]CAJ2662294.1 unnamed protein product [Trifolium pratense]